MKRLMVIGSRFLVALVLMLGFTQTPAQALLTKALNDKIIKTAPEKTSLDGVQVGVNRSGEPLNWHPWHCDSYYSTAEQKWIHNITWGTYQENENPDITDRVEVGTIGDPPRES